MEFSRQGGARPPTPGNRRREIPAMRARRDLVLRLVAVATGVSLRALTRDKRDASQVMLARHMAMYLLHVVFSCPLTGVGRLFNRDRTTAAYACQRIEDRRDDPAFDAFLHDLELAVSALDSAVQIRTKQEQVTRDDNPCADETKSLPSALAPGGRWAC
ncbi:MAG TPA: hypothetical protein ENK15_00485 [Thermopetrobacter sp.]|nr:hypothetical protein [Thermopetrobacter sp.]